MVKTFASDVSAVEYKLYEITETIKKRTHVSIKDLEEFAQVVVYVQNKIEELRKSRDNLRKKYEELKAEVR